MSDDLGPYYFLKMRINPNSKALQRHRQERKQESVNFFYAFKEDCFKVYNAHQIISVKHDSCGYSLENPLAVNYAPLIFYINNLKSDKGEICYIEHFKERQNHKLIGKLLLEACKNDSIDSFHRTIVPPIYELNFYVASKEEDSVVYLYKLFFDTTLQTDNYDPPEGFSFINKINL